jgi:hypothetical protein
VALRGYGAARLRRAGRGRAGVALLVLALYLAAGAVSTWPALREANESFLAEGRPGYGEAAPGDHLQSAYLLWLPGHQLERGEAPWLDPYSFSPEAEERVAFAGWPFALLFWPLHALLGTVGAWNVLLLLTYVGAGLATYLWLRELDLPRAAALTGGLVFALAPYRAAQLSAGHMLAPVSLLLPLALWGLERRLSFLAVAALASIPLSGQVHLALGAIPFFLLYAVLRGRRGTGIAAAVAGCAAGLLVYLVSIRGSLGSGRRSFAQVESFSAELADFVSREARHGLESFVFLGWLTPLLALAGLAVLGRERPRLAVALGLGALVPALVALGANLPLYEQLWRNLPGLRDTRVPERLLPVACLCLAGLAAFAVARLPRAAPLAVLALVALDLRAGVELFHPTAADPGNRAYAARPGDAPVLELPIFLPDRQEGSVYQYYAIEASGPRYGGYSTVAPRRADGALRELKPFDCGRPVAVDAEAVVVHRGLYQSRPGCLGRALDGLQRRGYREAARDGEITLYRRVE